MKKLTPHQKETKQEVKHFLQMVGSELVEDNKINNEENKKMLYDIFEGDKDLLPLLTLQKIINKAVKLRIKELIK